MRWGVDYQIKFNVATPAQLLPSFVLLRKFVVFPALHYWQVGLYDAVDAVTAEGQQLVSWLCSWPYFIKVPADASLLPCCSVTQHLV